jgi:hypothetical protein
MKRNATTTRRETHGIRLLAAMLVGWGTLACGPPQGAKTAVDRATFMERTRCSSSDDDKAIAPILGGQAVLGVRSLYSSTTSDKNGPVAELRGATLNVAALPGVTAEWLDRTLECHSAKETLGHDGAASDDPFWLPDATVDIDVRPAKDGFDIAVAGFSSSDARQILARANAFAKSKVAAPAKEGEPPH